MSNITKKVLGIIVLIIIVLATISLIKSKPVNSSSIKVGVILPLSGQYASLGESDRNAMLMAKKDLKADNIEFFFEDDKYDAKTAVTAYQKLKSINNIDALVVLSAPSIQSITPITTKDNIPLLALGATNVYEKDSTFMLMPLGNTIFPTLGKLYGEKYKKIAVAHSNARLFAENTRMFRTGLPADVMAPDFELSSALDYRTEVQKILSIQPEAVTVMLPKEDAIKFLQALRVQDRNGKVKIICDFGTEIAVDEYTKAIGKDRLEGCISTNIADTAQGDFKARYKEVYGSHIQITADYAYDSVQAIQQLAQSTSKDKWIEKLSSKDFVLEGKASGKIKFNEDGTRIDLPPTVHVYKDGKFVPVQ